MSARIPPPGTPEAPRSSSDRYLEAALELFVEYGFSGTSLQMIGDRIEVSKAAVNYHFRSKDELLSAVVRPSFTALGQMLDSVEELKRESSRRKRGLAAYIDYLIEHRRVVSWLSRDVSAVTHPQILPDAVVLAQRLNVLLTSANDGPIAQVWSAAMVQALNGPMQVVTDLSDDQLRGELEQIGDALIRAYRVAERRFEASAD